MAVTRIQTKTQNAVTYSSAAALNSQRGFEWRAYSESTTAPVSCVRVATSGYRTCVTQISGWSNAATPQTVRIRPGGTSAWGTCFWKIGLTAGTVAFDYVFPDPPVWGDYSGSVICEMTTSTAGGFVQGISAAGFLEKQA